ncbi:MAG: glycerate kinase [Burkholderiaceae bacterium]
MNIKKDPREFLLNCFNIAIESANPIKSLRNFLPSPPKGRVLVVGAGKAAASMAKAVEIEWASGVKLSGIVITRYAHGLPLKSIKCIEAGHPVPDNAGEDAAREIYESVSALGEDDLLLCLISGGGSSLLSLPADGLENDDIKLVTKELLRCGAPITDINIVRKHISKIQGGKLALQSKAPVCALIISDVVGDNPSDIASGPCSADPSTFQDAIDVLSRWQVNVPPKIGKYLEKGKRREIEDNPKPGDTRLRHVSEAVIATAKTSLNAVKKYAEAQGISCISMGDAITGEAKDVGEVIGGWAFSVASSDSTDLKKPLLILSGGECTVTVSGDGRGGRCAEFLLSVALKIASLTNSSINIYGVAGDTDGIDGVSPHAGVYFTPTSIQDIISMGVNPKKCLENNDALGVFEPLKNVITTGPTLTNVNDFRGILII